jgi:ribonuclease VapC
MVIDTSALVAIFLGEPERSSLLTKIMEADTRRLSAANLFETGIVLEARRGEAAGREFDLFVLRAGVQIAPVDAEQAEIARHAWRKYGKGRHPAGLNFGDCFAYALARFHEEPLLAKGSDFAKTDIEVLCADA